MEKLKRKEKKKQRNRSVYRRNRAKAKKKIKTPFIKYHQIRLLITPISASPSTFYLPQTSSFAISQNSPFFQKFLMLLKILLMSNTPTSDQLLPINNSPPPILSQICLLEYTPTTPSAIPSGLFPPSPALTTTRI